MMNEPEYITQIDFERFGKAFTTGDVVGSVLRCHFEIERAALRTLTRLIPRYDAMRHRYLSDHLKTLRAMRCGGPIFQVADYANKLRNEFAHDGLESISEKHVKELESQAGSGFGNKHIRDWSIAGGTWGIANETKLSNLSNTQIFVFVCALDAAAIDTLPQRLPSMIHLDHIK